MFKMISSASGATGGVLSADTVRNASTVSGDAQKAAISQMIAKLDSVGMPPDQSAKLILDQYKQAGILTPALMNQVQQQVSEFSKIKTNQPTLDTQMQALQRMSQMGQAGLTPDERAQQRLLQQQVQQSNNANQQSIIQNMQARGQQGSGAEIAARLGSSQGAANQASSAADQVSSLAAQRALQAIAQTGGMAGQINQQQFGQQAAIAGNQDQMQRFNTQNQMAINQQNVQNANQGQLYNLNTAQRISDQNVGQINQEQYHALERQRQNWLDKLQYAQAYAQPLQQYGTAAAQQAYGENMARAQGISSGFGALSSYAGQQSNQNPTQQKQQKDPSQQYAGEPSDSSSNSGGGMMSMASMFA